MAAFAYMTARSREIVANWDRFLLLAVPGVIHGLEGLPATSDGLATAMIDPPGRFSHQLRPVNILPGFVHSHIQSERLFAFSRSLRRLFATLVKASVSQSLTC